MHKILLLPDVNIALHRNAQRSNKDFDTAVLAGPIRDIDRAMRESNYAEAGWRILNNATSSIDRTVEEILSIIQA